MSSSTSITNKTLYELSKQASSEENKVIGKLADRKVQEITNALKSSLIGLGISVAATSLLFVLGILAARVHNVYLSLPIRWGIRLGAVFAGFFLVDSIVEGVKKIYAHKHRLTDKELQRMYNKEEKQLQKIVNLNANSELKALKEEKKKLLPIT